MITDSDKRLTSENLDDRANTCVMHPASAPAVRSQVGSNPPRGSTEVRRGAREEMKKKPPEGGGG